HPQELVLIAARVHLFPFRTQKLSSLAPTILGGRLPGKIGNANTKSTKRNLGAFSFCENARDVILDFCPKLLLSHWGKGRFLHICPEFFDVSDFCKSFGG